MAATIFSKQLQKLRKERGIKQEQLAEYLGVSTQAVSKWENGSYPDGDLLPQIAGYFGVSIDYLYGNTREEMTIDQRISEYMKEEDISGEKTSKTTKMLELLWMAHGSAWESLGTQLPEVNEESGQCGTCYLKPDGVMFGRLNKDMRYLTVIERPEDGYEEYVSELDRLAEVFRFFGEEENLRILLFLMSMKQGECIRTETLADYVDASVEHVAQALEQITNFSKRNQLANGTTLLLEGKKTETLYSSRQYVTLSVFRMLLAAKDILHPIQSYYGLWNDEGHLLMRRQKLEEIWKKKKGEKKDE